MQVVQEVAEPEQVAQGEVQAMQLLKEMYHPGLQLVQTEGLVHVEQPVLQAADAKEKKQQVR